MTSTPRERARVQTLEDITRIGRDHLAKEGAAALSLRAVARDLGVVSSAVYRYVKSRDELLTLLVVDAYNELGDEVDAALADAPADDYREQFRAIGWAVRSWALREPARYALLFGSPVPGYAAPAEQTTGPGTRVITALVGLYERAYRSGDLTIPTTVAAPAELHRSFAAIRTQFDLEAPDELIARGVFAWAGLFGVVNFEVFDQYGPHTFSDKSALFAHHLEVLLESIGLV
ncbi:WHG domain-containing protein [Antrihabitans sp. YC3-6]|uniref:WHG domain-containing protein n=1 Tax=Antrihabitans stalagmiti TaxID=2799499 RepID=A0A934U349_9NOCA|nr:TetR/AcrR family transcriptional regulator [Antrihabitans stalagmiti]MBJ8339257.1 WHG domain-containing protein [Antrihabitans stalagmiti]